MTPRPEDLMEPEVPPVEPPPPVVDEEPLPIADAPVFKAVTEWRASSQGRQVFLRMEDSTRGDKDIHHYVMWTDTSERVGMFDAVDYENAKTAAITFLLELIAVDNMFTEADDAKRRLFDAYKGRQHG